VQQRGWQSLPSARCLSPTIACLRVTSTYRKLHSRRCHGQPCSTRSATSTASQQATACLGTMSAAAQLARAAASLSRSLQVAHLFDIRGVSAGGALLPHSVPGALRRAVAAQRARAGARACGRASVPRAASVHAAAVGTRQRRACARCLCAARARGLASISRATSVNAAAVFTRQRARACCRARGALAAAQVFCMPPSYALSALEAAKASRARCLRGDTAAPARTAAYRLLWQSNITIGSD
jgi:hypothetical protein